VIVRLSHVGHVVRNVEEALGLYRKVFNASPSYFLNLPELGIRSALIPIGNNSIKLSEPLNPVGFVAKSLDKRGPGLYHICVVVHDLEDEVKRWEQRRVQLIKVDPPGVPFMSVWVHPKSTGRVR